MTDVLFITPNNSSEIYQNLSNKYSAIETPTWSLLLAESCRSRGYTVKILDTLAESLSDDESLLKINEIKPRLICFVVYGQNVNAGTTNMSGAVRLAAFIKSKRWIVNTCKEEILASSSKHVCFENLFQKKFKAVLTPSCSSGWQQIEFTNQKDKSIFLLTWL